MKVFDKPCDQCLLSKNAIVSHARRREIIKECIEKQTHFICHKATIQNKDVCCKTFYDELGHRSQLVRIAQRLGVVTFLKQ
jgi:hypothetical protein